MNRQEIEAEIEDLKADYTRLSADLEKLNYVGANTEYNEKELDRLANEISLLRQKLQNKS
ncbi:SE1832 family protein [Gracilibacillus sp. S3-1-1]|uniref:SE1832 family protein n=1 Tax=Gracilibacillus pellucidus TaxID=3095368 RepID=A0ACC6M296_9BACI|nr:SE1832 family protein [Gracilibacillus sp. S3-1-1]MDX8045074.1 SE1832 family protein [Gracilibacillus sp. S3-1-1]